MSAAESPSDSGRRPGEPGWLDGLHPSGFAAVPEALLTDTRADYFHRSAYASISGFATRTGDRANPEWQTRDVLQRRLFQYAGFGTSRTTFKQRVDELVSWKYIRARRGTNGLTNTYTLLPTGGGLRSHSLSELHKPRFSHVPRAVQHDPEISPMDQNLYMAIAWVLIVNDPAEQSTATANLCRIVGIKDIRTFRKSRQRLVDRGYVDYTRGNGASSSEYVLLPTKNVNDALASDQTRDLGSVDPAISGRRGGRPPGSNKGGASERLRVSDAPPTSERLRVSDDAPHRKGGGGGIGSAVGGASEARAYSLDSEMFRTCWCGKPHRQVLNPNQSTNLIRAVGRQRAQQANTEVIHRIYHENRNVANPYALSREIGRCYADGRGHRTSCRQRLHGEEALNNHLSRRREHMLEAQKQTHTSVEVQEFLRVVARDALGFPADEEPDAKRLQVLLELEAASRARPETRKSAAIEDDDPERRDK